MTEKKPLVIFMPAGRRDRVEPGQSLLDVAQRVGVEIESICGGRLTCGKCKVTVEDGRFDKHGIVSTMNHVSPASSAESELLQKIGANGAARLACSAMVLDDLLVFVPEESRAHKQIIRKSATERLIEVNPAIRQVYVEVETAQLGEHRGDWGRLQDALAAQWGLKSQTIDLFALRKLQAALRSGDWRVTVILWQEKEVIDILPGYQEGILGLAVDIGSTTIAGHLCDLRTGAILATESTMNPQVVYGEDLMSRVSYAMTQKNGLEKMHTAVIETLNKIAQQTARSAGHQARDIHEAVFVGNTTMIHILLGINPQELGGAPFALARQESIDLKARELDLRLHPAAYVHILPAEAGHVGADNVAVLLAEEPHKQDDMVLTVDVGTNAEIVLGNRIRLLSASSPTGPAFEGAQITHGMRAAHGAIERVRLDPVSKVAHFRIIGEDRWSNEWVLGSDAAAAVQPQFLAAGICGSGIIEVVAELFINGILLADGQFDPNFNGHPRSVWQGRSGAYILATAEQTSTGEPILVTQADVRNIQLAKAALYAGCKLLMQRAGVTTVDRIVLAGAFGSYIDPKYALLIGLIPDCDLDRITAVGNAAGDGARIALLNREKRTEAEMLAVAVKYIETAVDPDFQTEFVAALHLPHASDPFPHLQGLLPTAEAAGQDSYRTGRRRRRMRQ